MEYLRKYNKQGIYSQITNWGMGMMMKEEEAVVHNYLNEKYPAQVVFEPDGNVPPDFCLGNKIAIEVRRLNQNFFYEDTVEGLEELEISLLRAFREVLASFGMQENRTSYYVGIFFHRPIKLSIYEFKKLIKKELQTLIQSSVSTVPEKLQISDKIMLIFLQRKTDNGNVFRCMGNVDIDAGGQIPQMYATNIQYCIKEKSIKIKQHKKRYNEWWLVLVDNMRWDLDRNDINEITYSITSLGLFERLSIISEGKEILTLNKS